jgi:hypothetical protein
MNKLILLVMLLALGNYANAEPLLGDYQKDKDQSWFLPYISGVSSGYSWANAFLENDHKTPLFCLPPKLSMNAANDADLLDTYIHNHPSMPTYTPLNLILGKALIEAFPCK